MPPAPIGATGAATPVNYGTAAKPASESAENKDMFLKLMVAQLRYQNPLEPTDGAQFMAQTAQFTMVETLQTLAESQGDSLRWVRMNAAQGVIGKDVTTTDPLTGADVEGTATGLRATIDGPVITVTTPTGDIEVPLESISTVRNTRTTTAGTQPQA